MKMTFQTNQAIKDYPLFMPPDDLAEKGHLNWNKKELKRYFEWYESSYENRIKNFLEFFTIFYSSDPEKIFNSTYSEKIFSLFDNNEMLTSITRRKVPVDATPDIKYIIENEPPRQELTNLGYAIAADSGLLFGKVILDNRPDLVLATPLKGGKSYVHYNKVVIKLSTDTFGSSEWDPIGLGIMRIGYAINVSRTPFNYAKSAKEIINKK